LLQAAGVPPPNREFVQGWITKEGRKLSKTTGNVIDPQALVDRYGPDPVRYFLLRESTYGQDWDFTDQGFVGRYNSDLANDLGNLVSRALTMVQRYRDGKVPSKPSVEPDGARGFEAVLQDPGVLEHQVNEVFDRFEALDFSGAMTEVWSWIGQLNFRIADKKPWDIAKDPTRRADLDAFLYRLLEDVRLIAVLVWPVMPRAAGRIFRMLGLPDRDPGPGDLEWGRLEPGSALGAIEPLFPRIEKAADPAAKEKTVPDSNTPPLPATQAAAPPVPDRIDIADFAKIELRAALVTAAEKVEGSKKLVKLQVDLGTERRQVVAGIAESYAPETLVGKKVVIVANLKPAKLMGVESNGMVLAASVDGKAVLCTFDADVPPGARLK
jgi:methionyl-tRNA synthetase